MQKYSDALAEIHACFSEGYLVKSALQFFNPVKNPIEKASIETSMIIRVPNLRPTRDGIKTINRTVTTIKTAATKNIVAVSFLIVLK